MINKNRIWRYSLVVLGFVLLTNYSCKKEEPKFIKQKLTGLVQKGPYIIGTSISMYELDQKLGQTGNIFATQMSDNSGTFEINNVRLTSNYVEFLAGGYYFNEVEGDISTAPLNLSAISDISNISSINVNILTHLEKLRVEYLVKHDKTFSEAKKIAQSEILAIFGFKSTGIDNSETFDISVDNESNAILLAISVILQGNRSVGDLSELLASISNDVREDGILNSENIMLALRNSTKELVLNDIRVNLENRYMSLGIRASIPNFEKYINIFLAYTGKEPLTYTQQATNISVIGATLNGIVNANSLKTSVIFEYGTTTNYGATIIASQNSVSGTTNVSVNASLNGLLPGTTYHFRVKTENAKGIVYGNDMVFTTSGALPYVTVLAASKITPVSAQLNGVVNANFLSTTVTFEWGLTTSYGNSLISSQSPVTGNTNVEISTSIIDLTPGTTYHFRVKTENAKGIVYGNDMVFTTSGALPSVTVLEASKITPVSAQLNGVVNANNLPTSVTFEYGLTTDYGSSVIAVQDQVTGDSDCSINANINGLTLGTVYHFRVKSVNSMGTNYSSDMTLTTSTGYSIGDTYQGGIIFFLTGTYPNQHGLVCTETDQSTGAQWGCSGTIITGADGTSIGTGNQNTIDIINDCSSLGIAAQICYDLDLNGYNDWFLPSKDELGLIFTNLKANNIGNFKDGYYWSSSELGIYFAWRCNFVDGQFNQWDKNRPSTISNTSVRAVRAF